MYIYIIFINRLSKYGTFKLKTIFMTNFVFDTWKTSAPSENQRTSILTSYFFQHGRHRWHMVGKNTLAQRSFLTLGQR